MTQGESQHFFEYVIFFYFRTGYFIRLILEHIIYSHLKNFTDSTVHTIAIVHIMISDKAILSIGLSRATAVNIFIPCVNGIISAIF